MALSNVTFNSRGMSLSDNVKTYVNDKLQKMNNLDRVISISCEVGKSVSHKGVENDFYVRLLAYFPKATIRVKKNGPEIYAIIDSLMLAFQKMVNQYTDGLRKWEGKESWPKFEVVDDTEVEDETHMQYSTYTPRVRRKILTDLNPMTVAEAIQHLHFLGRDFYLYKDIENGKLCVVYKDNTEYLVLVPAE